MSTPRRRPKRSLVVVAAAAALSATVVVAPQAFAAGETVNVYLTTTSDSGGRVSTACLMNRKDEPQVSARVRSSPKSAAPGGRRVEVGCVMTI